MLIGLPGTGKSECARLTADALGWSFGDTDKWIESAYGGSIAEMFEREGEPFFRELERLTLGELEVDRGRLPALSGEELEKQWKQAQTNRSSLALENRSEVSSELPRVFKVLVLLGEVIESAKQEAKQKGGLILATGGGMPVPSYNQEIISKLGPAFYLSCDLEVLATRLSGDQSRPLLKNSSAGSSGDKAGGSESLSPLDDSQKEAILKRLQELLNNRRRAYSIAGEEIDTTHLTTAEVADKLKESILAKINM